MSHRSILIAVLVLATTACGAESQQADGGEQHAQAASHVIPAAFRGRWAEDPAACLSNNDRRYEIGAIHLDTARWSTDVAKVRIDGRRAVVDLEAPQGDFTFALALVDENTMSARYAGREEFGLTRCRA